MVASFDYIFEILSFRARRAGSHRGGGRGDAGGLCSLRSCQWLKKEDRRPCSSVSSSPADANRLRALVPSGHFLTRERVLEPLSGVEIAQKTVEHSPTDKHVDALVSILSGCRTLHETNCRLRPDTPPGRAFGRERSADQSTAQRTLDTFDEENVRRLRGAVEAIGRRHSAVFSHPFEKEMLQLEVDLTGLRATMRADGCSEGYFSGSRNRTGRQGERSLLQGGGLREVLPRQHHHFGGPQRHTRG